MSMQPANMMGPLTQQMNHLSLGTTGTVSCRNGFDSLLFNRMQYSVFPPTLLAKLSLCYWLFSGFNINKLPFACLFDFQNHLLSLKMLTILSYIHMGDNSCSYNTCTRYCQFYNGVFIHLSVMYTLWLNTFFSSFFCVFQLFIISTYMIFPDNSQVISQH